VVNPFPVAQRRCVVLGSAPLAAPLVVAEDELVVAVAGGIASAARCDIWVLNARTRTDATIAGAKGRLHRLMLAQGTGRTVDLVVFLSKGDGAVEHTLARLLDQGMTIGRWLGVNQATRHAIETRSGARTPDLTKHALSAGLFAAAGCLEARARAVRLEGCSWHGGYAYAPGLTVSRGHVHGDKRALQGLTARYGAAFTQALFTPSHTQGDAHMAKKQPSRSAAPAGHARVKVRATKLLQYDLQRKRPGDVFLLRSPADFKASCMERVSDATPTHTTSPAEAARTAHAAIAAGKSPRLQPNAADLVDDDQAAGDGPASADAALDVI
jgi:hypothetical protein